MTGNNADWKSHIDEIRDYIETQTDVINCLTNHVNELTTNQYRSKCLNDISNKVRAISPTINEKLCLIHRDVSNRLLQSIKERTAERRKKKPFGIMVDYMDGPWFYDKERADDFIRFARAIVRRNDRHSFLSVLIPHPDDTEKTYAKAIPIHRIDSFESAQLFPGEDHPNNNVIRIHYHEQNYQISRMEQKMIDCCAFQVGQESHTVTGDSSLDVVMLAGMLKA